MTTETEAFEAMIRHHAALGEQAATFAEAVRQAADADAPHETAVAEFVAFFGDEILPHAVAEENSIYPAAARHPELEATVSEMIDEHRTLAAAVDELADVEGAGRAVAEITRIVELFAVHVSKENELLLPVLLRDDTVDLAELLGEMHDLTKEAKEAGAELEELEPSAGESRPRPLEGVR
jgi:iron-sulfur cluster repair protein YtfE (RIC family)